MSVQGVKGLPGARFETVRVGSADKVALIQCALGIDPLPQMGMDKYPYWEFERCPEIQELLLALRSRDEDSEEMPREFLVDWIQYTNATRVLGRQRRQFMDEMGSPNNPNYYSNSPAVAY